MNIEMVIFDGVDELDVFAPYEVLSAAGFGVHLVVPELTDGRSLAVTTGRGLRIEAEHALGAGGYRLGGVVVPGGGWLDRSSSGSWAEAQRGVLPDRLRRIAPELHWIASVCTGAMLLAHAGLLVGRTATTNPAAQEELREFAAAVSTERVVTDGSVVTAGAPGCGLDLGLTLVEHELGRRAAEDVARSLQCEANLPVAA